MKKRDQLVEDLKARLDRWNAQATKWDARAEKARGEAIANFRARREEALYQLKLLENASLAAYDDAQEGAEKAWKALGDAYERARAHFEKSTPKTRA